MAHEGEEFVIALPAVMLGAAFLILKWAAGSSEGASDAEDDSTAAAAAPGLEARDLSVVGAAGKAAVEPPDEQQPAADPGSDQRHVQLGRERLAEDEHQEGKRQHAEDEQTTLHSV
jgi:hypothetical protein